MQFGKIKGVFLTSIPLTNIYTLFAFDFRGIANLAQFTGQSTANVIAKNLGTFAWALWISAIIALFSVLCAIIVFFLDKWLCKKYEVTDKTDGLSLKSHTRKGVFSLKAIRHLPVTFW